MLAMLTTVNVLDRGHPILLVSHDEDDCGWQMLCGTTNHDDDARVVSLRSLYDRDPSLADLADLPMGWYAWRETLGETWRRAPLQD